MRKLYFGKRRAKPDRFPYKGIQRRRIYPRDLDMIVISESTIDSMPFQPGTLVYL